MRTDLYIKVKFFTFALTISVILTGCATGYKDFYKAVNGATPELIAARRAGPPPATPAVERAQPGDKKLIVAAYEKRGFSLIGYSAFNSGKNESERAAIQQGQEVGADLVLILNPKYTGSVTTSVPIVTPTTSKSYSSGTATAYGAGAPVTAYANSTTTTYGTTTNYVPITVNRSDYAALYFIKIRIRLGAIFRNLSDLERQDLQTNKGVVINAIVDGSPAFDADILIGDMVLSVDGQAVTNVTGLQAMLAERAGKQITFGLLRRGQKIEKNIQLGM